MAGIPYAPQFGFGGSSAPFKNIFGITAGKSNVIPLVWNADGNNPSLTTESGYEYLRYRFAKDGSGTGASEIYNVYSDTTKAHLYGSPKSDGSPYGGWGNLNGGVNFVVGRELYNMIVGNRTNIQLDRYNNYGHSGFSNAYASDKNGVYVYTYHKPSLDNFTLVKEGATGLADVSVTKENLRFSYSSISYWGKTIETWDRIYKASTDGGKSWVEIKRETDLENPNSPISFNQFSNTALWNLLYAKSGQADVRNYSGSNTVTATISLTLSHKPNKDFQCNDTNGNPIVKYSGNTLVNKPYADVTNSASFIFTVRPQYNVTINSVGKVTVSSGNKTISWSPNNKDVISGYYYELVDMKTNSVFTSGETASTSFTVACGNLTTNTAYKLNVRAYRTYNGHKYYSSTVTTKYAVIQLSSEGFNGKPTIILPSMCSNNTMYWFKNIDSSLNNPFRFSIDLPNDKEVTYLDSKNLPRYKDVCVEFRTLNGSDTLHLDLSTTSTYYDGVGRKTYKQYWNIDQTNLGNIKRSIQSRVIFQLNAGTTRNIFKSDALQIRCGVQSTLMPDAIYSDANGSYVIIPTTSEKYVYGDWVTIRFYNFPTEGNFAYLYNMQSLEGMKITPDVSSQFIRVFDFTAEPSGAKVDGVEKNEIIKAINYDNTFFRYIDNLISSMGTVTNTNYGGLGQSYCKPIIDGYKSEKTEGTANYGSVYGGVLRDANPIIFGKKVTQYDGVEKYTSYPSDWNTNYKKYLVATTNLNSDIHKYFPMYHRNDSKTVDVSLIAKISKPNIFAFYYNIFCNVILLDSYQANPYGNYYVGHRVT